MKNYQIKGNELFVYMPEKQKLVKIDEGEIKQDKFFISVKHKGSLNLYQETDIGLFAGPKNVHEAVFVMGLVIFRRQSTWRYGGFSDQEKVLGTAIEEMSGVYRKAHGELTVIIAQPYIEGCPHAVIETIKYKSLNKVADMLLIERADGRIIVFGSCYGIVKYWMQLFVQYKTDEVHTVVLAWQGGNCYQKIYEGENLHDLKNVIIRRESDKIQMLQYNDQKKQLVVIAEGSKTTLNPVPSKPDSSDTMKEKEWWKKDNTPDAVLAIDDKEWWVKDNCLQGVKFDPNAKAEKQQPENWSLWKWFSIGRYFKS